MHKSISKQLAGDGGGNCRQTARIAEVGLQH